ncbi:MAG: hypothetical protein AAGJ46_05375 [Planctomycetota bacterium]
MPLVPCRLALVTALTVVLGTLFAERSSAAVGRTTVPSGSLTDGLDGLLDSLPPEEPTPQPEKAPAAGEDLGAKPEAPLKRIEAGMSKAQRLIAKDAASGVASRAQEQVISDIEELIKQAEQQCQQCNNPSSGSSAGKPKPSAGRQASQRSQPKPGEGKGQKPGEQQQAGAKPGQGEKQQQGQAEGQRSTERLAAAAASGAEARPPAELMKEVWGRLPARVRERMLESASDEFLPEYRGDIEQYFRRLAEQPE